MHDPNYYYQHDHYQPTLNPQSKQNNGSSHQENFQVLNNMPPVPNEFSKRGNNQHQESFHDINCLIPPSTEFHGYHNGQIQYIPNTIQSGIDLEKRLNHLSHQLAHIIQQNHQILRSLQKPPEQSKIVSTPSGSGPSGGTVIVRM